jgi:crotonobetainyl-CoA:carnitine CoA-transferase CaiB-like acyl-CoA transferase
MSIPLKGLRVIELGDFLPSAYCCMQLSDFGAEVVRIDAPREAASQGRRAAQAANVPKGGRSPFEAQRAFDSLGRNRSSIVIDLKNPAGRDAALRLVAGCDVLVEGFRPGVMDRLGLGYAKVSELNPRLVYCSVSLFGQTGPYREHPGHDPLALGLAGLLHLNSDPANNVPRLLGSPVGDISAGLHALSGVLLALRECDQSGRGQHVDISMAESSLAFSLFASIQVLQGATVPRLNKPNAISGVWETQDGKYIVTTNLEPHHWANFCRSIGREDLIPLRHDRSRRVELFDVVRDTLKTRTCEEWLTIFAGELESQAGPVHTIHEVFDDPHLRARGVIVEVPDRQGGTARQLRTTINLTRTPGRISSIAPEPGEHTRAILNSAGFNEQEIEGLIASTAVR